MLWSSIFVVGLAQLGVSKPLHRRWDDFAEKHSWVDIPRGWTFSAPAPADHVFELRIGLKQDKVNDLIANLMEVSDPFHER